MPKFGWRVADEVPDTPFALKFSQTQPNTPSGSRATNHCWGVVRVTKVVGKSLVRALRKCAALGFERVLSWRAITQRGPGGMRC